MGRHSLAWRCSLRRRQWAADLAGLCSRLPVQRMGGHPARAYAGHDWSLWCRPPPELFGSACQFAGLGARLSFGGRRASHSASYTAGRRAHTCGREAAALAFRRRVRGLSQPHVALNSWVLLGAWPLNIGEVATEHSRTLAPGQHRKAAGLSVYSASAREQCDFSGIVHRYITMEDSTKVALARR